MKHLYFKWTILCTSGIVLLSACRSAEPVPTSTVEAQPSQTSQVIATQVEPTAPATNTPLPTAPQGSDTPSPTDTPVPTETLAPMATQTSAPTTGATAYLLGNTNCRSGPSEAFPLIFTALKGDVLAIISTTTLDDYLIVENPQNPGQGCWLWTEYVEVTGELSSLPITTPPPTPTPALRFSTNFIRIEPCTGWSLAFKVTNTGSTILQSYKIVVTDQNTGDVETTVLNQFGERVNCVVVEAIDSLEHGKSGYIYANDFNNNPDDHSLLVVLTVCSNNEAAGECTSQGYLFTP